LSPTQAPGADRRPARPNDRARWRWRTRRGQYLRGFARRLEARCPKSLVGDRLHRQSLDAVVSDRLFGRIDAMFEIMGCPVVTLKYGRLLEAAFARPDGHHLREWIDACPNSLYSALVYKGGEGWREHLHRDLNSYPGIRAILDDHDDGALQRLMTNLAGHDMDSILAAFHAVDDDRPTCFIAYTIKGYGLPFAGHKDNHAGLMNLDQMAS